uniref:Pyridoxal 5'-phosphate synthase n=1 Tax=Rhabditophanes sp. KR3021 TaxID=114890 RepID=A0AC35TFN5_9BILA
MVNEPLNCQDIRVPYLNKDEPILLEQNLKTANPFELFDGWFKEVAVKSDLSFEEINSVCLSTCLHNKPSSRMVLMKSYDKEGFVFYTNKVSRKGQELSGNPFAAMLFYWPKLARQVRIEGSVVELALCVADEYWNSRPLASRIGSKSSDQGSTIPNRDVLECRKKELEKVAELEGGNAITRPSTWIGYRLVPHNFEFWQGQSNRLHDRLIFDGSKDGIWSMKRLSP